MSLNNPVGIAYCKGESCRPTADGNGGTEKGASLTGRIICLISPDALEIESGAPPEWIATMTNPAGPPKAPWYSGYHASDVQTVPVPKLAG